MRAIARQTFSDSGLGIVRIGETFEADDAKARSLAASGLAELVPEEKPKARKTRKTPPTQAAK